MDIVSDRLFDLPFHSSEIQNHTEDLGGILSIGRYMLNIMEDPGSEVEKLAGAEQNHPHKFNFYQENIKLPQSDSDLFFDYIEKESRNMLVTLCHP